MTPAFPLGTAYLPGDAVVLRVFESRYLDLVRDVLLSDRSFVSVLISAGSEVGGGDQRFNVGVLVEIDHVEPSDIGLMLYGRATRAINVVEWNDDATYPRAMYQHQIFDSPEPDNVLVKDLTSFIEKMESFFSFLNSFDIAPPAPPGFVMSLFPHHSSALTSDELQSLFWALARLLPSTPLSRCELLADQPFAERVRRASEEIDHLEEIVRFRYGN